MVETKIIALTAAVLLACSCEYTYTWEKSRMDGHRTGVTAPNAETVAQALGTVDDSTYLAPNGTVWQQGSATYAVANDLIAVQPLMKELKTVVGYATDDMTAHAPESELSNWWVDHLMASVARLTGRKVDVGILNFGGIRTSIAKGDILLEDFVSMFPFKNNLVYVGLKGSDLQEVFNTIAASRPFVLGGVKMVVRDHRIDTLLVGGKPIDPERVYGVATVDFLLDGGDGMTIGRNARELRMTDSRVIDAVLTDVRALQAAGQPMAYYTDGRLVYDLAEEE